jgi:regulatory protein YycI of two-component signal transduction system YycFG
VKTTNEQKQAIINKTNEIALSLSNDHIKAELDLRDDVTPGLILHCIKKFYCNFRVEV